MLYNDDCLKILSKLKSNSIDLVVTDPPYFLSNGGLSIHSGKIVSVDKGEWDKASNYDDISKFNYTWLKECYRLLKFGGSLWVSGTAHNIFDIEKNIRNIGYKINNIIIWEKTDPPPLIYKTRFRYSYEFIIWCSKGKPKTFNYNDMYNIKNCEMTDVWKIPAVQMSEKKYGYHPTQKPIKLIERIIKATSSPNDVVLDPFMGSGTTVYVSKLLSRKYIGIELENKFYNIAVQRLQNGSI